MALDDNNFPVEQFLQQATPRNKKNDSAKEKNNKNKNQKKQIASFLLIVLGILMLLSLVTYSHSDEGSADKIALSNLYSETMQSENKIGPLGALVSNFLINSTIGYVVFVVPFLVIAWGWTTLRKGNIRRLTYFTNYVLVLALLMSVAFRLLRYAGLSEIVSKEFHGDVGSFLATVMMQYTGLTGAFIISFSLFFIVLTLAVDLDLHATSERLKNLFVSVGELFGAKMDAWREQQEIKAQQREEEKTQREILVKRPDAEVAPAPKKVIVPQVKRDEESEEIKPLSAKKAVAQNMLPVSSLDVPLEINEAIQEKEAELDEREVEDEEIDYVFPSVDLLDAKRYEEKISDEELKANAALLQAKLADFDVEIANVSVTPGPVVTLYELVPATGVKVAKIVNLSNDLALAMQAKGIRIEAPIPGKGTVGVEIPNHKPSMVTIRSILNSEKFRDSKAALPLAMGKTITGEVFIDDLAKMPHLLIAGATGMGKSVGINTIIASLLYRLHPSEVKFVLIDPKKIELSLYLKLQKHYLAVSQDVTDEKIITTPNNAVLALKSAVVEMENRYTLLASAGVRHITDYNTRFRDGKLKVKDTETMKHRFLPYIVIIIDELADLMITAAKEVEEPIARIAQLARAVGIHLILATQRPSVDVITGVIKANFSARIAYAVSSKIDSRTILDGGGADQLIGRGDMLYLSSSSPKPIRIQNAFISTEEVEEICEHIGRQKGYSKPYELPSALEKKRNGTSGGGGERDELFDEAARVVVRHQQGSVSLLQRRLSVGYSRAARIVDQLEEAGIVGPFDGSKAREVRIEQESDLEILLRNLD